jgi:hypothetical protein
MSGSPRPACRIKFRRPFQRPDQGVPSRLLSPSARNKTRSDDGGHQDKPHLAWLSIWWPAQRLDEGRAWAGSNSTTIGHFNASLLHGRGLSFFGHAGSSIPYATCRDAPGRASVSRQFQGIGGIEDRTPATARSAFRHGGKPWQVA